MLKINAHLKQIFHNSGFLRTNANTLAPSVALDMTTALVAEPYCPTQIWKLSLTRGLTMKISNWLVWPMTLLVLIPAVVVVVELYADVNDLARIHI